MTEKKPENTNMRIWEQVCTTDPANTKHIDQRGGFTAIDAYSQIQRATEVFGPVGEGWGWGVADSSVSHPDLCIVEGLIWYRDGDSKDHTYPIFGAVPWIPFGSKVDADAPKKALTDAITKGLSYLGFNADVFLGKFDDNKYVAEQAEKHGNGAPTGREHPADSDPPDHEEGDEFIGSGTIKYLEIKGELLKFSLYTENEERVNIKCWSDHTHEAARELKADPVTVTGAWTSWTNDKGRVYWSVTADQIESSIPF